VRSTTPRTNLASSRAAAIARSVCPLYLRTASSALIHKRSGSRRGRLARRAGGLGRPLALYPRDGLRAEQQGAHRALLGLFRLDPAHPLPAVQQQHTEPVDEQAVQDAHHQAYSQGNAGSMGASSMGAAAAMQVRHGLPLTDLTERFHRIRR
jgi:hypothetical protein